MRPIHLLIPMSGQGTRYQKVGYREPKPLIPVSGEPMIARLLSSFPERWPTHFVMADNHRDTELPRALTDLRPQGRQLFIPMHSEGPARAIEAALPGIPDDDPVLVSYCDYGMSWDPVAFERFVRDSACDACVISYRGFHAHYLSSQMYAYSRLEGERVVEVREKGCFTDDREREFASSGGYYFRSARLLRESLARQRELELRIGGEYYTSLTVQALLRENPEAHVRVFEIPSFFQWGTPEDLRRFEYWERTWRAYNLTQGLSPGTVSQVLMPMAGLGSRLRAYAKEPKPFIPIEGEAMFRRSLRSLPTATDKRAFVSLNSCREFLAPEASRNEVVYLDTTPDGQALSTQAGVPALDPEREVLVSSCDHSIVLRGEAWHRFHAQPGCDAAIFTVRGFPGADVSPKSFAYVVPKAGDRGEFPEVERVSVKQPVSDQPSQDPLLVGTFWFKSARALNASIDRLRKEDLRVNGELYLDSVFEPMLRQGLRVRLIPLDGYVNWGDPESLAEALYWLEVFSGRGIERRPRFPGLGKGEIHA